MKTDSTQDLSLIFHKKFMKNLTSNPLFGSTFRWIFIVLDNSEVPRALRL